MALFQALLYIAAVLLLLLAAFGVRSGRVSLTLLAAAAFILGFALPAITSAWEQT